MLLKEKENFKKVFWSFLVKILHFILKYSRTSLIVFFSIDHFLLLTISGEIPWKLLNLTITRNLGSWNFQAMTLISWDFLIKFSYIFQNQSFWSLHFLNFVCSKTVETFFKNRFFSLHFFPKTFLVSYLSHWNEMFGVRGELKIPFLHNTN